MLRGSKLYADRQQSTPNSGVPQFPAMLAQMWTQECPGIAAGMGVSRAA